ncbi:MAG: IS982 family transposase, partial [Candidatus Electrothrix sp. AUS1_2]|nr:IS982 family transposase [Candidatus Electrothrix sp. AUS1_2]
TAFSGITGFFPKKIHAVTPQGFALKVISCILVFSIRFL